MIMYKIKKVFYFLLILYHLKDERIFKIFRDFVDNCNKDDLKKNFFVICLLFLIYEC
jgi:hypothetical protein